LADAVDSLIPESSDIEACIHTTDVDDVDDVVSLLSRKLGPLAPPVNPPETEIRIHEFGDGLCILQPSEDGFVSVWIRGSTVWRSSTALGRYLGHEMPCTVRCHPGKEFDRVHPQSDVFLEICGVQERLVMLR
jgi:hypothetical protein